VSNYKPKPGDLVLRCGCAFTPSKSMIHYCRRHVYDLCLPRVLKTMERDCGVSFRIDTLADVIPFSPTEMGVS